MLAVYYKTLPHKLINGTLFYCFEHYVLLSEFKETSFYLYGCTEEDFNISINLLKEKYNVDSKVFDNIHRISTIRELHHVDKKSTKTLILDSYTFSDIYAFIKRDIVVYNSHYDSPMIKSNTKNITWFGYYDYQDFTIKERLSLYFDIFREMDTTKKTDTYYISSPLLDITDRIKKLKPKESIQLLKSPDKKIDNLFEKFDTMYYVHTVIDVNNRAIPEAFYYKKNIELILTEFSKKCVDSITLRYNDIKENGLQNYTLSKDSLIIKEMLSENITTTI